MLLSEYAPQFTFEQTKLSVLLLLLLLLGLRLRLIHEYSLPNGQSNFFCLLHFLISIQLRKQLFLFVYLSLREVKGQSQPCLRTVVVTCFLQPK